MPYVETMTALIFDGVLDRFPHLRFSAIELGASWVPSWMRFMESGYAFSSDFPDVEGGRNPLKRFNDALEGASASARRRFYRDNFIDLMGDGLDKSLYDLPGAA